MQQRGDEEYNREVYPHELGNRLVRQGSRGQHVLMRCDERTDELRQALLVRVKREQRVRKSPHPVQQQNRVCTTSLIFSSLPDDVHVTNTGVHLFQNGQYGSNIVLYTR